MAVRSSDRNCEKTKFLVLPHFVRRVGDAHFNRERHGNRQKGEYGDGAAGAIRGEKTEKEAERRSEDTALSFCNRQERQRTFRQATFSVH
jgi:hypothetical protein